MKTILITLCLSFVATAALAGYCTDERWEDARRQQETFSDNFNWTRNEYSEPNRHFRRGAVLLFQYGGGNLDKKKCYQDPAGCEKFLDRHARGIDQLASSVQSGIEKVTAYIKDGEDLVDRWHVLAGACHELDPTNLKKGKKNAANVRKDIEHARQWLHELKVIIQAYKKEKETLEVIKMQLQSISKGADQSEQAKQ